MTAADTSWTSAEAWAWERIRAGEIADFNARDGQDAADPLDPAKPEGWTDDRRIRASILRAVLLTPPWSEALLPEGVRLVGALIEGRLALTHAKLPRQLWLERCRLPELLAMEDTEVPGWFSLEGSWLGRGLDCSGARLASQVSFDDAVFAADFNATQATFASELRLRRVRVSGVTYMNGVRVTGNMAAGESWFRRSVTMRNARVTGNLDLTRSALGPSPALNPDLLRGVALDLERAEVGGWLFLRGARIVGSVDGHFTTVAGSIDLRPQWRDGASNNPQTAPRFATIDLPGADIKGELLLDRQTRWRPGAVLNLRNAHAGAIQDDGGKEWPPTLHLAGFAYDRLGGFSGEDYSDFHRRPVSWFLDWLRRTDQLSRQRDAAPRPWLEKLPPWLRGLARSALVRKGGVNIGYRSETYERLARALRAIGRNDAANAVLFESREIARRNAEPLRAAALWLSRTLIGYGIGSGYFRAFFVVVGIAVASVLVMHADRALFGAHVDLAQKGALWMLFGSVDHLLPVVTLDKEFGDLIPGRLVGWGAKLWFWITALFGWVLGSFLVAGLAGFTQRS